MESTYIPEGSSTLSDTDRTHYIYRVNRLIAERETEDSNYHGLCIMTANEVWEQMFG